MTPVLGIIDVRHLPLSRRGHDYSAAELANTVRMNRPASFYTKVRGRTHAPIRLVKLSEQVRPLPSWVSADMTSTLAPWGPGALLCTQTSNNNAPFDVPALGLTVPPTLP